MTTDLLRICCHGMQSNKLTERRNSANRLWSLLENRNLVNALNSNNDRGNWETSWNYIIGILHSMLIMEAQKYQDEEHLKKGLKGPVCNYGDLLLFVTKSACKGGKLNISKLILRILHCFSHRSLQKYFGYTYLSILKTILSEKGSQYWSQVSEKEWVGVLDSLVKLYDSGSYKTEVLHCLQLLFQSGPLYSMPGTQLRQKYPFMVKLCLSTETSRSRVEQEVILKLSVQFCLQTVADSRITACDFGEKVFRHLMGIFQETVLASIKRLILEFFLLQIQLHHPNGAVRGSNAAYACSWEDWIENVTALNSILCNEMRSTARLRDFKTVEHDKLATLDVLPELFATTFVELFRQASYIITDDELSEPASKRQRIQIGISYIIEEIQESQSWPWINFVSDLLEKYPDLEAKDFVSLLKVLSAIQSECTNSIIRRHVYKCLAVLVDIEAHIDMGEHKDDVKMLWAIVWECTLRAVGMNDNPKQTHALLQKLILECKAVSSMQLFRMYESQVLNVTKYSLETLDVAGGTFGLPQSSLTLGNFRKVLIKWILNFNYEKCEKSDTFAQAVTARVLLFLTFKYWPKFVKKKKEPKYNVSEIEDVYLNTSFEGSLLLLDTDLKVNCNREIAERATSQCLQTFDELDDMIVEFVKPFLEINVMPVIIIKTLTNVLILLAHLVTFKLRYNLIKDLDGCKLKELINVLFIKWNDCVLRFIQQSKEESSNLLSYIQTLFTADLHDKVQIVMRQQTSKDFILALFEIVRQEQANVENVIEDSQDERQMDQNINNLQHVINLLCSYTCVPNESCMFDTQIEIFSALSEANVESRVFTNHNSMMLFLSTLKNYKPGLILDPALDNILNLVNSIAEKHCTTHTIAEQLLDTLYFLYPHVAQTETVRVKEKAASALLLVWKQLNNFGPSVTLALLKCFGQLVKFNPSAAWTEFEGKTLATSAAHFLTADYQKVRLTAISNLSIILRTSHDLNRQNCLYDTIVEKCQQIITVEGDLSEEQTADERLTRSASALHAFAMVIAASTSLRRKALFQLIYIVYKSHLNEESLKKILNMVAKHLSAGDHSSLLQINLNYLVSQWHSHNINIYEFLYRLLGCSSFVDFCSRYSEVMVPILLTEDLTLLKQVCEQLNESLEDVFERVYAHVHAKCTLIETAKSHDLASSQEISFATKCMANVNTLFPQQKLDELLIKKLNELVIYILEFTFDPEDMSKRFTIEFAIPEPPRPYFPLSIIKKTIGNIEEKYLKKNLIEYLLEKHPEQLQNILIQTIAAIHNSLATEDRVCIFYQFSLLVDMVCPYLNSANKMHEYLIRTILFTLLHFIQENNSNETSLNLVACEYTHSIFQRIIPSSADVIDKLLVTFVSILVPIAKSGVVLATKIKALLDLLVVENGSIFPAIKHLDPFPQDENFCSMQDVYNRAKYSGEFFNLELEIHHFLTTGSLMGSGGYRTEGLKHLKKQLATRKAELKQLYANLYSIRGFSEDCENSILHRLICSLVKLSLSHNNSESTEATRCLGELGSANLLTTVLQTERKCEYENSNAFELVTGCVTALLSQYIVDPNIKVMLVASDALYEVLACKEGKQVLTSGVDYGYGKIDEKFLAPFITSQRARSGFSNNFLTKFTGHVTSDELWCPEESHDKWITELVCCLLTYFSERSYLNRLGPVCKAKVEFSESLLPLLIYLILSSPHGCAVADKMRYFFEQHWKYTFEANNSRSIAVNKASVQCMLNVVHFIRLRQNIEERKFDNVDLNYLHVAQAAQFCTAHFSAILYVELWCQNRLQEIRTVNCRNSSYVYGDTSLDIIFEHEDVNIQQIVQNILKESYKRIGEQDAVHTCEILGMSHNKLHVEHYEHLQRWDQVALLYDIQVSQGDDSATSKLLNSLKHCSLYQVAVNYKCLESQTAECFWRLSRWDTKTDSNVNTFESHKYRALKAFHDNESEKFCESIQHARQTVIDSLQHVNLESTKDLYEPLSHLQALQELESFFLNGDDREALFENWKIQDEINRNEFYYVEPVQAQRIVIVNDLISRGHPELKDMLIDMHLQLIGLARLEDMPNVATRSLVTLLNMENLSPDVRNEIAFEEAQMYWLDDKTTARYVLKNNLLNKLKTSPNPRLQAAALKLCGKWMAEMHSENPQVIINEYFYKSLSLLIGVEMSAKDIENRNDTYNILARFTDSQYQRVRDYVESAVFETKVQNMMKSEEAARNIQQCGPVSLTTDERRAIVIHQRQSKIDKNEIDSTLKEKNFYLKLALQSYILSLKFSDINNLQIFRILSLWLEGKAYTEVGNILKEELPNIATFKYIPVIPQLIPHVTNNEDDSFGQQINEIICTCAQDHPHHVLQTILALANSYSDKKYYKSSKNASTNEPRVLGAQVMLRKLKAHGDPLKTIIERMEATAEALMELAYLDPNTCKVDRSENYLIPKHCRITKIKQFDEMLLPTHSLPIEMGREYADIVGIHSFGNTFQLVGGLNAPKKITCIGSDGVVRVQLVKGMDDLREDAVMQQVFSIMNEFFRANKQTAKLLIRTYKIVPLSQRSGVMEWVSNSMTLSDYLLGKGEDVGAHRRYNGEDMTPPECRRNFKKAATLPPDDKLSIFLNICSKFQPVFHKFFEENFVQPALWYERRRAYTYSVATSSMCGYILGLGDRHLQNILIDKRTAEVIHIDFGIAFEQGRILPTPETVPFRLTRDIEAGMGVFGVEGVFRKTCEKTLEVLRKNSETIIAILEVLLYNPLYAWTITPDKVYTHQLRDDMDLSTSAGLSLEFNNGEKQPVNIAAERALLRLRQKLDGTADGDPTNIEGQVEKLIQQAHDPSNLCRVFEGWQPYV